MFTGPAALDKVRLTSSKLMAGAELCIGESAFGLTGDMG
jgi:hypothetical protein